MHIPIRDYLDQLADDYAGDPLGYLWEFAPVHAWWHNVRRQGTQPIGFLTFHHLVIQTLGRTFPQGMLPVQPSAMAPYPAVLDAEARAVGDLAALAEFSEDIEGWHNGVHNSMGGTFADPRRNIYLRMFWEFHAFLDAQFAIALEPWLTFDSYFATVPESDQRDI